MQYGPQYYLQSYLSMTSGNWVTKLYILGLSLYFIVALTAQRFPFPAYKPAFRPGLFAFSAFVTKHNSLARETAYLLSPKKKEAFPKLTKKKFFASWDIHWKTFLAILRFKNHPRLLQTFEQTIEQPQEGTSPLQPSLFIFITARSGDSTPENRSTNQTKVPFVVGASAVRFKNVPLTTKSKISLRSRSCSPAINITPTRNCFWEFYN